MKMIKELRFPVLIAMLAIAVFHAALGPAPAGAQDDNTSCIDGIVHVDTGYVNDSDYVQWVNIQLNGSGYAEVQLSPGESLGPSPLNSAITPGGEFIISVTNADDPYDGIHDIRIPFGPKDCSPTTTTTTTTTTTVMVPTVPDSEDALEPPSTTTPAPVTKKVTPRPLSFTG
jgi:hypothetical protein